MFRANIEDKPGASRRPGWAAAVALLVLALSPLPAPAQFLRIGPFDFTAKARTGAVWSDNIDGERPSEAQAERQDYFVYGGLDLKSETAMSGGARLTMDTGFTVEKHFIREDLDNSENPLGRFRAEARKTTARLDLRAFYGWERTSESTEIVIPGVSGLTRNPQELTTYGWGGKWTARGISLGGDYDMEKERYDKKEYQEGDRDTETINYLATWRVFRPMQLEYEAEHTREDAVNDADDNPQWETTETVRFNFDDAWKLWRRPKVTFSLGVEREDENGQRGEWEPIYEVTVQDTWDITPRLKLDGRATYTYEDQPEEDDIAFVYDVGLEHLINSRTLQRLKLTREPRRTFGSTEDSDSTTWSYELRFSDLFIPSLTLGFQVAYDVTIPPDGPTERIWNYVARLEHLRQVTSRLRRGFIYSFTQEDSNLEDELLTENRVEWNYIYDL